MALAIVTRYALLEIFVGYVVDQLRKNGPANIHSYIVLSRKNVSLAKFFDLTFKSFPLGNTAIHNDRKDLQNITKYFTGH